MCLVRDEECSFTISLAASGAVRYLRKFSYATGFRLSRAEFSAGSLPGTRLSLFFHCCETRRVRRQTYSADVRTFMRSAISLEIEI